MKNSIGIVLISCSQLYFSVQIPGAPCPRGKYKKDGKCLPCTKGYYKELIGDEACNKCEDGKTTYGLGSTDQRDCSKITHHWIEFTKHLCCTSETLKNILLIVILF